MSAHALASKSNEARTYYDIYVHLDNIHEIEVQCETVEDFYLRGILWVFLHECAHFKTENEKKADSLVKELIKNCSRDKVQNS